ncbi:hypothetical protein GPECTOR_182g264 [Gonium pectorale]|uniref:Ubiquitin-like protease family profile domain-containing protein n=1 Tax=Gonium pectorale TaxID=33097 RepID=A0A150FX83_GONPE|nr:hypothetical protein GPECTOR_182g264 [Gonium pectorale]|eukprot:KXZ42209.1 hypothetical protein GPECTOR_182g264 [Gonium pectorale]
MASSLDTLEGTDYIGESIIDARLGNLVSSLPKEDQELVHICDTHFARSLRNNAEGKGNQDLGVDKPAKGASRPLGRNIDPIQKRYLVVLIHEHLHYSVMMVCQPGNICAEGQELRPVIIHMDSIYRKHNGLHDGQEYAAYVRAYLSKEWRRLAEDDSMDSVPRRWRQEQLAKAATYPVFDDVSMPFHSLGSSAPQQPNNTDCAAFVMMNIEFFLAGFPEGVTVEDGKVIAVKPKPGAAYPATFMKDGIHARKNAVALRKHLQCWFLEMVVEQMPGNDPERSMATAMLKRYRGKGPRYLPPREYLALAQSKVGEADAANLEGQEAHGTQMDVGVAAGAGSAGKGSRTLAMRKNGSGKVGVAAGAGSAGKGSPTLAMKKNGSGKYPSIGIDMFRATNRKEAVELLRTSGLAVFRDKNVRTAALKLAEGGFKELNGLTAMTSRTVEIFRDVRTDVDGNLILDKALSTRTKEVFDVEYGSRQRKQIVFTTNDANVAKSFRDEVKKRIVDVSAELKLPSEHLVTTLLWNERDVSQPPLERQAAHTDNAEGQGGAVCIAAIQDFTLLVYTHSERIILDYFRIKAKVVKGETTEEDLANWLASKTFRPIRLQLRAGDLLFMQGHTVHAGDWATSEGRSYRMHFYIAPRKDMENQTFLFKIVDRRLAAMIE